MATSPDGISNNLLETRHVGGETFEAFGPAAVVRVARSDGFEDRVVQGKPGLGAVLAGLGQRHGAQGLVAGVAGLVEPGPGKGDLLGLAALAVDAGHAVLSAFRRAHAALDGAAGLAPR